MWGLIFQFFLFPWCDRRAPPWSPGLPLWPPQSPVAAGSDPCDQNRGGSQIWEIHVLGREGGFGTQIIISSLWAFVDCFATHRISYDIYYLIFN